MIGEITWAPRAETVYVELIRDAKVVSVEERAVDFEVIHTVALPYSDARYLVTALARYLEPAPADDKPADVDALRATVVRQANEITELKGERA